MKELFTIACLLLLHITTCAQPNVPPRDREQKKMREIMSAVSINGLQKTAIHNALTEKRTRLEAIDGTLSAKEYAFKKYEIEKACHNEIIKLLSEKQITDYCETVFAPEVSAKTEYRISLLTDVDNEYTETDIETARKYIYKYLMLEKIVYFKYKYDFAKQKDNISRLKAIQPSYLKSSINNEKQKGYGKVISGKVNWKNNIVKGNAHE